MGKTKSDARREMIDILVKKSSVADKEQDTEIPDDGCPYFDDEAMMAQHCPKCKRAFCY